MKNAVLSRHGRLLALCGLSAALHLLVLDLVARHGAGAPTDQRGDAALLLSVRLAAPAAAVDAARPASAERHPEAPREPSRTRPPAPPAVAESAAASASPVKVATRSAPAANAAGPAPAASDTADLLGVSAMQPRYQIKPPSAARLLYRVIEARTPGAPARTAFLDWRPGGSAYSLDMDGVLGRHASSGVIGDEGIVPARPPRPDGGDAPAQAGSLDDATLWVWLASVGNGFAGQLEGGISVTVADTGGVHPVGFQVVGQEDVETGLGPMKAWHLAQFARPGEARVDAWLAPALDWLPVQLRVTRPDGSVATQVLERKESAGAP